MIKLFQQDMWDLRADAHCILTNGVVKSNGSLVMGAGQAKQALSYFPGIDKVLGNFVKARGNNVTVLPEAYTLPENVVRLISFPTKHHWSQKSDLGLIEKSAVQLLKIVNEFKWDRIILPAPGIGLGGLEWKDVEVVLKESWGDDTRFYVVTTGKSL